MVLLRTGMVIFLVLKRAPIRKRLQLMIQHFNTNHHVDHPIITTTTADSTFQFPWYADTTSPHRYYSRNNLQQRFIVGKPASTSVIADTCTLAYTSFTELGSYWWPRVQSATSSTLTYPAHVDLGLRIQQVSLTYFSQLQIAQVSCFSGDGCMYVQLQQLNGTSNSQPTGVMFWLLWLFYRVATACITGMLKRSCWL